MGGPPLPLAMATTNRPQSRPASPKRDGGPSRLEVNESAPNGASRVRENVALTFDDVLLVPRHSLTHPRDVNVTSRFSRGIELRVPLFSIQQASSLEPLEVRQVAWGSESERLKECLGRHIGGIRPAATALL